MSDEPQARHDEHRPQDKPFSAMTFREKLGFMGKALVFFVSGGFIFPTLWVD